MAPISPSCTALPLAAIILPMTEPTATEPFHRPVCSYRAINCMALQRMDVFQARALCSGLTLMARVLRTYIFSAPLRQLIRALIATERVRNRDWFYRGTRCMEWQPSAALQTE